MLEIRRPAGSPGSIVYLFTFKPDFYARVGFKNDTVTMRRL